MILILAPTMAWADLIAREKGLRRNEWRRIVEIRDVEGISRETKVYAAGSYGLREHDILMSLKAREIEVEWVVAQP